MKKIELSAVSYAYGAKMALRDISVAFAADKITAVMGRSGSGKSTLLQLILGLMQPDSGRVAIEGRPHSYPLSARERFRFGYVIQGNGLFPHLTVSENISLPGKITRLKSQSTRERVSFLLDMAGLDGSCAGKFPYQLSTTEQLRVAISRAYFLDPPVLLMDEPFNSLEADCRRDFQLELLRFQKMYPRTILLVTHDLAEAQLLADDIVMLDAGRVQQTGPKQKVLTRPANLQVRHLLQETSLMS
jgi:osmoprotectant transport system ATP-binding protein